MTENTWRDPNARTPWRPGPDMVPCPSCGTCGCRSWLGGPENPPTPTCPTDLMSADQWTLRCVEHGMNAGWASISGPPYKRADGVQCRLALCFGVGGAWIRDGYGNTFEQCLRDAMASEPTVMDATGRWKGPGLG